MTTINLYLDGQPSPDRRELSRVPCVGEYFREWLQAESFGQSWVMFRVKAVVWTGFIPDVFCRIATEQEIEEECSR